MEPNQGNAILQDPAEYPSRLPGLEPSGHGDDVAGGVEQQPPEIAPEIQALIDERVAAAVKTEQAAAGQRAREIANKAIAPFQSQAAQERAQRERVERQRSELETRLREELGPDQLEVVDKVLIEQGRREIADEKQAKADAATQQAAAEYLQRQAELTHTARVAQLETLGLKADDPAVDAVFRASWDGTRFNGWDESNLFWGTEIAKIVAARANGATTPAASRLPDPAQPISGPTANASGLRPDFYQSDPGDLYEQAIADRRRTQR